MDVGIIGDEETVLGYRLLGIPGWVAGGEDQALECFRTAIERAELELLLLTGPVQRQLAGQVASHRRRGGRPLIGVVASLSGEATAGEELEELVRRAIGIKAQ